MGREWVYDIKKVHNFSAWKSWRRCTGGSASAHCCLKPRVRARVYLPQTAAEAALLFARFRFKDIAWGVEMGVGGHHVGRKK